MGNEVDHSFLLDGKLCPKGNKVERKNVGISASSMEIWFWGISSLMSYFEIA